MSGNYIWLLDVDSALEYYDRCLRKEAVKEEEKTDILIQMYKEGLISCMGHTELSKDELSRELSKIGRILKVEKRDESI